MHPFGGEMVHLRSRYSRWLHWNERERGVGFGRGLEDQVKMLMDVKMCASYIVETGR
jgi:hypothetical protein